MRKYAFLLVCALVLAASPVRAEFYRWLDRDGREFFTNDPEKVPHEYRKSITLVKPDDSRVSIGTSPVKTAATKPGASIEHTDKYGRGEAYWRKRATKLRTKLHDLQDAYNLVLKQLADQEQKPKKAGRKKRSGLENKKAKLEKDIVKARRALETDLPTEARKADAYPGWIRE